VLDLLSDSPCHKITRFKIGRVFYAGKGQGMGQKTREIGLKA